MGTPARERFELIDPVTGKYYYLSGGAVLLSDMPIALKSVPADWEDSEIKYIRSSKYKGVFSNVTNDYSFTGDGAKILRYLIYTQGIAARCLLRITLLNYNTWLHTDVLFEGEIDFETLLDEKNFVKAGCLEPGIAADLKTNDGTDYEIPIESDAIPVSIYNGAKLKGQYNYVFGEETEVEVPAVAGIPAVADNGPLFNLLAINTVNEGSLPVAIGQTANPMPRMGDHFGSALYGLTADSYPYREFIFESRQSSVKGSIETKLDVQWETDFHGDVTSGKNLTFRVDAIIAQADSSIKAIQNLYLGSPVAFTGTDLNQEESIDTSFELTYPTPGYLVKGDRIFICFAITSDVPLDAGAETAVYHVRVKPKTPTFTPKNSLTLNVRFNTPSQYQLNPDDTDNTFTDFFGYRWYQLFYKLIDKIGAGKYGPGPLALSNYLSNPNSKDAGNYPYRTILATGDMFRRIPNAPFKVNLKDLFQDGFSRWGIGLGVVNNQVRIEKLPYFYDKTTKILDLGEVSHLKLSPLTEGRGTSLRIGLKYDESNKLNGRNEYNTTQTYRQPVVVDKSSEIDLSSPFQASMYTIEDIRLNLYYQGTTDSSTDNSVFVVSITNDRIVPSNPVSAFKVFYPEDNGGTVEGVYFPETAYNVDLAPGLCRERLKPYLTSLIFPISSPITFQTAERNDQMRSRFSALEPFVNERADLLPDPANMLFMSIVAEFECIKEVNVRQIIQNNPYGYIEFTYFGATFKGFMQEVTVQPLKRANYTWKLLLTPDNDLSAFIK